MYQGQATLVQKNPQIKWVFWGVGGGIALLTLVATILLPAGLKHIAKYVGGGTILTVYSAMLSRGIIKPKLVTVNLYVDQSGIYADNAPLVRRDDITQAYVRPAFDKQVQRIARRFGSYSLSNPGFYWRFSITTPSLPLTIEMMTRSGQLNIDPGGEGPAGEILTALGIPVTTCPPGYRPQPSRSSWGLTAVIVGLVLAAMAAYYFFMVYKTMHRH